MIMLHDGMTYRLAHGRVWITETTQVTLSEWLASDRDHSALVWRVGQIESGFAL